MPPQNIQRLLSKCLCCSWWVSLLSLPSLSEIEEVLPEEEDEDLADLLLLLLFCLFLPELSELLALLFGGSVLAFSVGLVVMVVLLVVGLLGVIGLGFTKVGFLMGLFPVTGVDGMCEFLYALKGLRFSLLSYDVLDSFSQSGVIVVTEYAVIPMRMDC